MRMYVSTPQFYIRPRNTDWLYNRLLTRLTEFNPDLDVYLQQSFLSSLAVNLRKSVDIVRSRYKLPVPVSLLGKQESRFSRSDVRRSKPDFIYGQAPTNIDTIPLVFNCGPTYPDVLREAGEPEAFIARDIRIKRECAARANLIASHSQRTSTTSPSSCPIRSQRCAACPSSCLISKRFPKKTSSKNSAQPAGCSVSSSAERHAAKVSLKC